MTADIIQRGLIDAIQKGLRKFGNIFGDIESAIGRESLKECRRKVRRRTFAESASEPHFEVRLRTRAPCMFTFETYASAVTPAAWANASTIAMPVFLADRI